MRRLRWTLALLIMASIGTVALAQPGREWVSGQWQAIQLEHQEGMVYAIRTEAYGTLEVLLDGSWGEARDYWQSIKPGAMVRLWGRVEGKRIFVPDPNLWVPQSGGAEGPEELILPHTLGVQSVLIILTRYRATLIPVPYLPVDLEAVMRDDVNPALAQFSFGQLGLDLPEDASHWMTPWLEIPLAPDTCTIAHSFEVADLADAAAIAAGYDVHGFERLVYATTPNFTCPWRGLGTIGGSPSLAWLNGHLALSPQLVLHELGHNLGLFHSHSCRTIGDLVLSPSCTVDDQGDFLDTMGRPLTDPVTVDRAFPPYNASQLERLGWLGEQGPPITEVVSSGVYPLAAYAAQDEGSKALKIRRTDQVGSRFYYLEARRAVGEDAFLSALPSITQGVTLHISDMDDGQSSFLLDAHPQTATWNDAALTVGETYTEPNAQFSVHVRTAGPEGSDVAVSLPGDDISLELLTPWSVLWHEGEVFRLDVRVRVGTMPAEGARWEWGYTIPGDPTLYRPADGILGPDGEWHFSYPLTPGGLPLGVYTIYARASWEDKMTPIASGQLTIAP